MITRSHQSVMTPWGTVGELTADYRPSRRWHSAPATRSQLAFLQDHVVPVTVWLTKGEASHLIGKIRERLPPTSKQECFLRNRGLWYHSLTRTEASQMIAHVLGDPDDECPFD